MAIQVADRINRFLISRDLTDVFSKSSGIGFYLAGYEK